MNTREGSSRRKAKEPSTGDNFYKDEKEKQKSKKAKRKQIQSRESKQKTRRILKEDKNKTNIEMKDNLEDQKEVKEKSSAIIEETLKHLNQYLETEDKIEFVTFESEIYF